MEDTFYATAVRLARNDLWQAYGDPPPSASIRQYQEYWVPIRAHTDIYYLISFSHRHSVLVDVSEWTQQPNASYSNDEDGSFAWVATNADALYKQYPDRWILVDKAHVVSSATEPEELMRLARTLGIKEPFITMTGPPELPGKAVYSGQVL